MTTNHGVHHVALAVTDLERARRFYGDILGLTPVPRPDMSVEGAWFAAGPAQVHLVVNPYAETLRRQHGIDSHEGHVALRVPSYDEMMARLARHGIEHSARAVSAVPWRRIFVADPDGNMIELVDDSGG